MSLSQMPEINAFTRPAGVTFDPPSSALTKWADAPVYAATSAPDTIDIFDVIGTDPWTGEGFNVKRMSAALRSIGQRPVTVNINSPGGDMFDGLAMYNQLREHPAKVTVKVLGVAASAASIIAMAGDEVLIGAGAFLMIHNAWGLVVGNRHDMAAAAETFAPFDAAMADIYAARTGLNAKAVAKLMDAETWLGAGAAIEQGFADGQLETETETLAQADGAATSIMAKRRIDAALALQGMPRTERRRLLRDLNPDTQNAVEPDATQDAGDDLVAGMRQLIQSLKSEKNHDRS